MSQDTLFQEVDELKSHFDNVVNRLLKEIDKQQKVISLADKRERIEHEYLQKQIKETQELKYNLEELFNTFIKMLADAIDIKSPYTGSHCVKVPEISIELAKLVNKKGANINLKEIEIASWLHDVGKIATPEYIIDKATKLETIYNRIHEIRMRFEVLYRDVKIQALQRKLEGENPDEVDKWEKEEFQRLTKEWEFIANLNIGSEFVQDEDIEKLQSIAQQEWIRYFDDNLGLSWVELQRKPKSTTPAVEKLLANKSEHIIPRDSKEKERLSKLNIKMDIPEYFLNMGEIYNLSIRKGTLTPEELYKIKEHIVVTILMLEKLPLPRYLSNVPKYAGTHHEQLNGQGYPRKLDKNNIPLGGKIIAFADIFEALTANDRPYKRAKKLSEAIKIIYYMVKDNHLDRELFRIFLENGLHMKYAKKYLRADQIDEVDVEYYLSRI